MAEPSDSYARHLQEVAEGRYFVNGVKVKYETKLHPTSEKFLNNLERLKQLHIAKARGDGTAEDPLANLRASERFGVPPWIATLIRMNDKIHRLAVRATRELGGSDEPLPYESLGEECDDISNYAQLIKLLYEEGHSL